MTGLVSQRLSRLAADGRLRLAALSARLAGGARWRLGLLGPRRLAAVAVVVALCAVMALWYTEGASAGPPEVPPAGFYQVPNPLPIPEGRPGQLIRAVEIQAPASPRGTRAWAILYHSRSIDGRDVAVSGMVVAPPGGRQGVPRPVVAWAHPTSGLADRCAPSRHGVTRLAAPMHAVWLDALLRRGYVVVATDYEGLGTPGIHPYLVGESEGHSVLDGVRAAGRLRGAHAGGRVAVWGFSQGGHAALWTGQVARAYAPDVRLTGVVAVSPGGSLEAIARDPFRPKPVPTTSFAVAIAAAWHEVYGVPLDILTPAGRAAAQRLHSYCPSATPSTTPALRADPRKVPAWRDLIIRNQPGWMPIHVPVLIAHAGAEGAAPLRVVHQTHRRLCGLGVASTLRVYPGLHHGQVIDASGRDVLAWLDARLAGHRAAPCAPPR
jgi:dienelactone hydrolase